MELSLTFNASNNISLSQLKNEINANDLNIDFIYNENERVVVKSRMKDKGTIKSNIIYDNILKNLILKLAV